GHRAPEGEVSAAARLGRAAGWLRTLGAGSRLGRCGHVDRKMGLHGNHTSELIFENCEVPAENLIGEEGLGYTAALKILAKGRITLAARCVGSCEKLVELSVSYGKTRKTMKEMAVERFYRDARITRIYEGSSKIQ